MPAIAPPSKMLSSAAPERGMPRRWPLRPGEVLLALGAALFIAPVLLIGLTSLKPDGEIVHFRSIFPEHPTLGNFAEILGSAEEIPVFHWLLNSLLISSSV